VQEIRLARSSTFVSPKDKALSARQSFDELDGLAVVKSDALSLVANTDNVGDCCVLLGRWQFYLQGIG